jgi:hypothetical protein
MFHKRSKPSLERCKDSGLALVLICLICFQIYKSPIFTMAAVVFLVLAMTYPRIFELFARLWFGLSTALGTVVSKVVLAGLFFVLVLPVGLMRRALGRDSMRSKRWRQGQDSVFRVREHRFKGEDLGHPY